MWTKAKPLGISDWLQKWIYILLIFLCFEHKISSANQHGRNMQTDTLRLRSISGKGLVMIRDLKPFSKDFSRDPKTGGLVVGYGHECILDPRNCSYLNPPITAHQANIILRSDLKPSEKCVNSISSKDMFPPLTDDQFAALVSFAFHESCLHLIKSKIFFLVQKGMFLQAGKEYEQMITHALEVADFVRAKRLMAEKEMFYPYDEW